MRVFRIFIIFICALAYYDFFGYFRLGAVETIEPTSSWQEQSLITLTETIGEAGKSLEELKQGLGVEDAQVYAFEERDCLRNWMRVFVTSFVGELSKFPKNSQMTRIEFSNKERKLFEILILKANKFLLDLSVWLNSKYSVHLGDATSGSQMSSTMRNAEVGLMGRSLKHGLLILYNDAHVFAGALNPFLPQKKLRIFGKSPALDFCSPWIQLDAYLSCVTEIISRLAYKLRKFKFSAVSKDLQRIHVAINSVTHSLEVLLKDDFLVEMCQGEQVPPTDDHLSQEKYRKRFGVLLLVLNFETRFWFASNFSPLDIGNENSSFQEIVRSIRSLQYLVSTYLRSISFLVEDYGSVVAHLISGELYLGEEETMRTQQIKAYLIAIERSMALKGNTSLDFGKRFLWGLILERCCPSLIFESLSDAGVFPVPNKDREHILTFLKGCQQERTKLRDGLKDLDMAGSLTQEQQFYRHNEYQVFNDAVLNSISSLIKYFSVAEFYNQS